MGRKVLDYRIVSDDNVCRMQGDVKELIDMGWTCSGESRITLFEAGTYNERAYIIQPMVLYEEELDSVAIKKR
jgi:hypothetical protein